MSLLATAILLGMVAASAITLFRALPPGKRLAATGKRPWACDICMSFWAVLALTVVAGDLKLLAWRDAWSALPAYIVSLWLVIQTKGIDFEPLDGKKDEK